MQELIYHEIRQEIGRSRPGPLHLQIAQRLAERIQRGELIAGQPLPPQRRLCKLLGVGEVTVRRGLKRLTDQGLLLARQGSGTVVAGGLPPRLQTTPPADPRRQPFRLGILSTDRTDGYPFMQPLLNSIERVSRDHPLTPRGVDLRMLFLPQHVFAPKALLERIPVDELDGLVMMSPINASMLAVCQQGSLPYVLLFNDLADGVSPCVVVDYGPGVLDAVTHLRQQGRSRFALVTSHPDRFSTGQMTSAFRVALQANRLPARDALIRPAGYHPQQGFIATRSLLDEREPPDAIICASAHQARGALEAIQEAAPGRPRALSLVAFSVESEDTSLARPFHSIDIGLEKMTEVIFLSLLRRPGEAAVSPRRRVVSSRFLPV